MINWSENAKVKIEFDDIPRVGVRYILPSHTKQEKASIKKYPFILRKAVNVNLYDKIKECGYGFKIPKDYCYDGASIPRAFWRLVGAPTDNKFLIAALIHDFLCEHHHLIMNDREFSTNVFDALLQESEVNGLQRFLMRNSVDFFQKYFCDWGLEYNK